MKGSLFLCLVVVFISCLKKDVVSQHLTFDKNYVVTSSQDHVLRLNGGTEVQLTLDQTGGLFNFCFNMFKYFFIISLNVLKYLYYCYQYN
ncbi:hypothetical protein IC582_020365 [Cucumis melo]